MSDRFDVLVIGEGIAGLTVAGLLASRGLRVASFESNMFGGLVLNVTHLKPLPVGAPSSGAEYAANLLSANIDSGVTRFEEEVKSLTAAGTGYVVSTGTLRAEAPRVIVASGARWKVLGVRGETELEGRGVSHCADCDGRLFSGQNTVVAGGGDSALQEALVLADYCKMVHLVVRNSTFKAQQAFVDAVKAKANIEVTFEAEVVSIEGKSEVTAVNVQRTAAGETHSIACSGFFPFIGLVANTAYLPSTIRLDGEGSVMTDAKCATNLPGVWAIGAVRAGADGLLSGAVTDAYAVVDAIAADHEKQPATASA